VREKDAIDSRPPGACQSRLPVCYTPTMRSSLAASLVLGAALLVPARGRACSCAQISAREALEAADSVFEGRVLELRPEGDRLRVRFAVVQHWKDADAESVEVLTLAQESLCGVNFVEDTSWLGYARREGAERVTGRCDRTRRIEEAEADLEVLQSGVVPIDVGPDDEVEPPAPRTAPSQAGCWSCAVGQGRRYGSGWLLLAALVASTRRRRRRQLL